MGRARTGAEEVPHQTPRCLRLSTCASPSALRLCHPIRTGRSLRTSEILPRPRLGPAALPATLSPCSPHRAGLQNLDHAVAWWSRAF